MAMRIVALLTALLILGGGYVNAIEGKTATTASDKILSATVQTLNINSNREKKTMGKSPIIVLRSSWQTVNIGDISHSPGMMEILTRHYPEAQVVLWPYHVENGVEEMLNRYYPQVKIVKGERYSREIDELFKEADFFLHGSGPMVAIEDLIYWRSKTDKPYGIAGVTIESIPPKLGDIINNASFFFARDSITEKLIKNSTKCQVVAFGPDAAFSMTKADDEWAEKFMKEHGLEPGRFLCAVSRIRYTPYHLIEAGIKLEGIRLERHNYSLLHQTGDLAPLLGLIKQWLAHTDGKVVLCPEMSYEMELNRNELFNKLTPAEQQRTVCMDKYWLPDMANGLYKHATALVSMEMHSPILSLAQGVPSFYLQLPTDTCKGEMWRDIGLNEWIYRIPEQSADTIWPALRAVADNPVAAKIKTQQAMSTVTQRQQQIAAAIKTVLNRNHQP